jgi:hypothetical protein
MPQLRSVPLLRAMLACLAIATCSSSSSGQGVGTTIRNFLLYGGATVPPPTAQEVEEVECPRVTVAEGGAALRSYVSGRVGAAEALRHQISIANVARECVGRPDGTILVKVGVEGRALVGPAGSPGRFDVPVRFVIRRGETVYADRTRRVAVAIAAGETHGTFVAVEEGMAVPANIGEYEIEVALGAGPASERPARRARR